MISSICARMMLGIRRVIDQDDHLSAMRPSDMHISNMHISNMSDLPPPPPLGDAESYPTAEEEEEEEEEQATSSWRTGEPLTPPPAGEGGEGKELPSDLP